MYLLHTGICTAYILSYLPQWDNMQTTTDTCDQTNNSVDHTIDCQPLRKIC